jgi:hypothetical protein
MTSSSSVSSGMRFKSCSTATVISMPRLKRATVDRYLPHNLTRHGYGRTGA